jgi:hypothetical protein
MGGGFSGTLQGQYSNISAGSGGGSANEWGGAGSAAFGTGWGGLKLQVDGGYQGINVSGGLNANDWDVDGAAFWQGGMGRIGGTVGYNGFSDGGTTFNITNYGGFAEWYAAPMFTVGVKGGGLSANNGAFGNGSATYIGGEAVFYAMPNLALNANIDYLSSGHNANITDYGGTAEWLVSESTPISVYGGYTYTQLSSGGGHLSTWMVGLKFYCNGNGAATLADRQRTGNASWGTETNLINAVF